MYTGEYHDLFLVSKRHIDSRKLLIKCNLHHTLPLIPIPIYTYEHQAIALKRKVEEIITQSHAR